MKKGFTLLLAMVVLTSTFLFSASKAQAAGLITFSDGRFIWGKGLVFVFDATDVKNKDLKGANIFAGSDYYKMYCSYNDETEKIVCVVGGGLTQYEGETGIIYLAGQMFYVTIPGISVPRTILARPQVKNPAIQRRKSVRNRKSLAIHKR